MPQPRTEEAPRRPGAILLADNLYLDTHAKTSHGLVRGPSRYRILGVVDPSCAGRDAGEVLDGRRRDIPIIASVDEALAGTSGSAPAERPITHCVVGVATAGGYLPDDLRASLAAAARAGLTLVNGLHFFLGDDPELARLTAAHGGEIIDIRRPRPTAELAAWSGRILEVRTPRLAVLGTDCALGKRTTAWLLAAACEARGVRTEVIYTGQTGWLQGGRHGFIFDSTLNDFVSGEVERVIVECARETAPDLMLLEGQSSLRNPYGPCGSELICSARAAGVILQHAPGRRLYVDMEETGLEVPPVAGDLELVRLLGSEVWALTLNHEGIATDDREAVRAGLETELGVPVVYPLPAAATPASIPSTTSGAEAVHGPAAPPSPGLAALADLIIQRLGS